jgi:hypothetical protein
VFFGGRWTYRHFKNDKPQTVAVITQDTNNTTDQTDNSGAKDTTKTDTMSDANTTTPASPAVTPATTPTPAPSPASDTTTKLADTGPGDIAPAFMTATATGILIYRRKLAKTAKKA